MPIFGRGSGSGRQPLGNQNYFAELLTVGQVFMGGADFGEGKRAVDDGLEASGEDVAENFVQVAEGSHVGAEDGELAGEEEAEVDFGFGARGGAAGDEGAGGLEGADAFIPGGGTDVFDDDIGADVFGETADFGGDFLFVVVDDVVCAEF